MVFVKKMASKMGMAFKIFMRVAVCYLCFSRFLLTAAAVPATRSLSSSNEIKSRPELESHALDGAELMKGGGTYEVEGRMELEINDYPGAGPNPRHDPPPVPATATP